LFKAPGFCGGPRATLRRIDIVSLIRYVADKCLDAGRYLLSCVTIFEPSRLWLCIIVTGSQAPPFPHQPNYFKRTRKHSQATKHMTRLIEFAHGVLFSADVLSADWLYVATGRAIPLKVDSEQDRAFATTEVPQKTSGALPEQLDLL
jgi:hypothetical protein